MVKFSFKIILFYFSFIFLSFQSYGCTFNCNQDKGSNNKITAPSHSGYEKHKNYFTQSEHNFSYISDESFARRGKYYQKFELRDGDCFQDGTKWDDCKNNRERVEFASEPKLKPIGIQCFAYSIKLHKDFIDVHPTNTDLGQVHQIGGPTGTAGGLASFPPLIQLGAKDGRFYFGWHELTGSATNVVDNKRLYFLSSLDDMKEKWTDISFCLNFKDKRMDVWINGLKKHEILKSPINFIPKEIYFKYGIYRSFISRFKDRQKIRKKEEKMPTQIVYYDEIRRGNSIEEVDFNINPELKFID